jgi:hypothetical protein
LKDRARVGAAKPAVSRFLYKIEVRLLVQNRASKPKASARSNARKSP